MRERAADRRLMRYLHGELPAEQVRELRAELARDAALQARLAELHRLWQGLQPSPPTPAPFGFVPKLQRIAEQRRVAAATSALGWGAAPPWARALAGAALVAGMALGVGLGRLPQAPAAATAGATASVPALEAPATSDAPPPAGGPVTAAPAAGSTPVTPGPAAQPQQGSELAERAPDLPDEDTFTDEGEPLASGSTLAEEYWQALEGSGEEGGEESATGW